MTLTADRKERPGVLRRSMQRLPPGTLSVGAGLAVLGLAAYGYLAISGRTLGAERFAPVATLWVVVHTLGPGLFHPLELETARAVAEHRALGLDYRPVVMSSWRLGGGLLAGVVVAGTLASGYLERQFFDGSTGLLIAALFTLAAMLAGHVTRGVLAGSGEFARYGLQLAVDGVTRVAGVTFLAIAAYTGVGGYGAVLAVAGFGSVIVSVRWSRGTPSSARRSGMRLGRSIAWLLVASTFAQLLINAGPLAVAVLGDAGDPRVGRFVATLVIARIPVFLMAAVQAALLPRLSHLVALGDLAELRSFIVGLLRLVAAVGALGVGASALIGPAVQEALFGAELALPRADLVLLAISAALYMPSIPLTQGLVANRQYRSVALAWASGVAAFVAGLAIPLELVRRVEICLVLGSLGSLAVAGMLLERFLRRSKQLPNTPPVHLEAGLERL